MFCVVLGYFSIFEKGVIMKKVKVTSGAFACMFGGNYASEFAY